MNEQRKIKQDYKRIYDMLVMVENLESTLNVETNVENDEPKQTPTPTEYAFMCGQLAMLRILLKKYYNINPDTVNKDVYKW